MARARGLAGLHALVLSAASVVGATIAAPVQAGAPDAPEVRWACEMLRAGGIATGLSVEFVGSERYPDRPRCAGLARTLSLSTPVAEWRVSGEVPADPVACELQAAPPRVVRVRSSGDPALALEACHQLAHGLRLDTAGTWIVSGDGRAVPGAAGQVLFVLGSEGGGQAVLLLAAEEPVVIVSAVHGQQTGEPENILVACAYQRSFYELVIDRDSWYLVRGSADPPVILASGPIPNGTPRHELTLECRLEHIGLVRLRGWIGELEVEAQDDEPRSVPWSVGFIGIGVGLRTSAPAQVVFSHITATRPLATARR